MAKAAQIANYFLEASGGTLTPLQLLKLVYIAHGWSFPLRQGPLLDQTLERIEAWQYGPVIPDLYHATKVYRGDPVSSPIPTYGSELTSAEKPLLAAVFKSYGRFSGGQLSAMTHRPGTPWDIAWKRGKNSQITDDMIAAHYKELAARNAGKH